MSDVAMLNLPFELLSIIFQLVHQEAAGHPFYNHLNRRIGEIDELLSTRTPYSLAVVHSQWQRILSTIPALWTDIIILLDSVPQPQFHISAANAGAALSWSHDICPINVIVTRRADLIALDNGQDYSEPSKGKLLAKALGKHVSRCKVICYNVIHSSTLLSIAFDILGREEFDPDGEGLPELTDLVLMCCIDDGYMGTLASSRTYFPKQLAPTPALRRLFMDGRNFIEIATHFPEWFAELEPLLHLTIAHLRSWDSTREIFTLGDAFKVLGGIDDIECLTLKDLEFAALEDSEVLLDSNASIALPTTWNIVLQDLGETFMKECYRVIDFDEMGCQSVTMKNCHLGDELMNLRYTDSLNLEDLHPAHGDLAWFVQEYIGDDLSVTRCSSFTDKVLETLTDRRLTMLSSLRKLTIVDCEYFTVAALKDFVASFSGDTDHGFTGQGPAKVHSCHVSGRVPDVSKEDQNWFGHYINDFTWETKNQTIRLVRPVVEVMDMDT